jgi:hypothetical protein
MKLGYGAEVDILQPKDFPEACLLIYFMVLSLSSFLSMLIVIYHSESLDISVASDTLPHQNRCIHLKFTQHEVLGIHSFGSVIVK